MGESGMMGMKYERRAKKAKLRKRHGENCWLCGGPMDFTDNGDLLYATFDHVIPRANGGTDSMSNMRLSHRVCNERRGILQNAKSQHLDLQVWEDEGGSTFAPLPRRSAAGWFARR